MAQCQSCGKRGVFLSLNRNGVCGECAMHVPRDVANRERIIKEAMMPPLDLVNRERIIKESMALVEKTTNLDTMMSRLDLVTEHLNVLVGYEQRGIPTTVPAPSHLLAELEKSRGQIIHRGAEDTVKAALAEAAVAVSQRTAISTAEKALMRLQEIRGKTSDPAKMDALEGRLAGFIHDKQLEGHLDAAQKAEFKGQPKKAIDAYQEALYLLRTDRIDDVKQAQQISEIEEKLKKLGGHSG